MKRLLQILLLVLLVGLIGAGWLLYELRTPANPKGAWQIIAVPAGSSLRRVAGLLEQKQLISGSGRKAFFAVGAITGQGKKLQPGRYRFNPAQSPGQMMDDLVLGKVYTEWITVPEGFTVRQIGELLDKKGIGSSDQFDDLTGQANGSFATPFPKDRGSLEGYLFPDTYQIDGRQGQPEIIKKMLARFDGVVWRELFKGRARVNKMSLHEVVTLASLVEGEARKDVERPIIAGVLLNRIYKGMRLECDATVQYALEQANGERKTRLLFEDLKFPSPYNTYLHAGLPPGPINNPGRASIAACLQPTSSPYLFYVARPDGSHIFSRTFADHRAAIATLRR